MKKEDFIQFYEVYIPALKSAVKIAKSMSEVSTSQWWTYALTRNEETFKKTLEFIEPKGSRNYFIQKVQNAYMTWKSSNSDLLAEIEDDEKVISSFLSPNSALCRFFRKRKTERFNSEDFKHFVYLDLWMGRKSFIGVILKGVQLDRHDTLKDFAQGTFSTLNRAIDIENPEISNALIAIENFTEDPENNAKECIPNIRCLNGENVIALSEEKMDLMKESIDVKDEDVELEVMPSNSMDLFVGDDILKHLGLFFVYLNTGLLGVNSKEVVDMLKNQPFSDSLQHIYEDFCYQYPDAAKYEFADTVHKLIAKEDIAWEKPKSKESLGLSWSRIEIQKLYDSLLGTYIDEITDARDFFRILTGYQPLKQREIKKINWVHKEISSLAFFAGELRKIGKEEGVTVQFKQIPKFFVHNGAQIESNLSTLYGNCNKDKYEDILKAIDDAKDKNDDDKKA